MCSENVAFTNTTINIGCKIGCTDSDTQIHPTLAPQATLKVTWSCYSVILTAATPSQQRLCDLVMEAPWLMCDLILCETAVLVDGCTSYKKHPGYSIFPPIKVRTIWTNAAVLSACLPTQDAL